MRNGRSHPLLLALALLELGACEKPPPRQSLQGWPVEQAIEVGVCRFRMPAAWLYHSTEWHLEVDMSLENLGAEKQRCSFEVQAITSSGQVLTESASGGVQLQPGESMDMSKSSREANMTGFSGGPAEDAWLLVKLTEGRWPVGTTRKVHATPARERPPYEEPGISGSP